MFWLVFFFCAGLALMYASAQMRTVTVVYAAAIVFYAMFGHSTATAVLAALAWALLLLPLNLESLRQEWFTRPIFAVLRRNLPAAHAGTAREVPDLSGGGWEAELLGGQPDWYRLRKLEAPALSDDERDYLGGVVETFCRLCDEWRMTRHDGGLSDEAWTFLRRYRFLGLGLPRRYGGQEFSATARSAIITKIASSPGGIAAAAVVNAATVGGCAELLLRHGSDTQKQYWLPRLAAGEEIGCVALSAARGTADLALLADQGVICDGDWDGYRVLGVRLDFDHSYVMLAPLATVIAVAFNLSDPDGRLDGELRTGLSCALLPRQLPGIVAGSYHLPLDNPMPIGPVKGHNVFVPLEYIVGGVEGIGKGRTIVQECVALSRSIALPSACAGTALFAALSTAAYMRLRRAGGLPLSHSEAVREALARLGARAYAADALRRVAAAAVDSGELSLAAAAITKTQAAELARAVMIDAMDLLGAKGAMLGPSNWLGRRWEGTPIAIGADGANLPARARLVFAQGLMRCHPYWLAELEAARDDNRARALVRFDELLWPHIGRILGAGARALVLGLTGAMVAGVPGARGRRHRQRISRYSAALALAGDASLLQLGHQLRERETLCAHLADVWSQLVVACATLRKWDLDDTPEEDWPLVDWICTNAFETVETALAAALRRVPGWPVRWLLRALIFPLGRHARPCSDELTALVAARLLEPGLTRQRLRSACFAPRMAGGPLSRLEAALEELPATEALEQRVLAAQADGRLPAGAPRRIIDGAIAAQVLSADDGHQLRRAYAEIDSLCAIDAFDAGQLRGSAA